jgi:hypothetical protein
MRESGRQLGLSLAAVDESQPNMEKEGIGEVGGKIKEENLLTIFAKWLAFDGPGSGRRSTGGGIYVGHAEGESSGQKGVVVSNGEEALDYFYRRGKFAMHMYCRSRRKAFVIGRG